MSTREVSEEIVAGCHAARARRLARSTTRVYEDHLRPPGLGSSQPSVLTRDRPGRRAAGRDRHSARFGEADGHERSIGKTKTAPSTTSATAEIDAPVEVAWELVADIGRPATYSDECTIGVLVPLAALAGLHRLRSVRDHLLGIDPRLVLGVQLGRVIGAASLLGWTLDDLDAGFALPADIADLATGVAAAGALAALVSGTLTRRRLVLFTTLGLGDFAVAAVTDALIVRPEALEELRWILFPTPAVPFFAVAHITARDRFHMATVSETGSPHVRHRGGEPGFVRILGAAIIGSVAAGRVDPEGRQIPSSSVPRTAS
ncbi:MAG: hypothetical protein ACE5GB_09420 [Acidimicrobiales bacterium]